METQTALTPQQAAQALKDAGATEKRSAEVYRYQRAAPYLLLWGIIWIVGYGGSDLLPRFAGRLWFGLLMIAMGASMAIGRRASAAQPGPRANWRYSIAFTAIWCFFGATYSVMGPINHLQQGAFPPLVVALAYVLTGLWSGLRFVVAGMAVAALTLGGFFYLPQHFLLWEGLIGGGALILAGIWFRRV
ncbi:MAG TPA: hypothetical protein VHZ32_06505 [Rhizomicrobium sp.]|nr:hypothetical protein [Rhizomicrobium sp.]